MGAVIHYVIRVVGRLSDDMLTAFPMMVAEGAPPQTMLHGQLPDQAALSGVLDYLDELGIEILEVSRVPELPASTPHPPREGPIIQPGP